MALAPSQRGSREMQPVKALIIIPWAVGLTVLFQVVAQALYGMGNKGSERARKLGWMV